MEPPHVLIVDDDSGIRHLLTAVCKRIGMSCDSAVDGMEAVEKLQSETFDIVLLDLMMPRMNGYEVIERISAMSPRPIIVVLTAQGKRQTETLDGTIVHTMLQKPFDIDLLTTILKDTAQAASERRRNQAADKNK